MPVSLPILLKLLCCKRVPEFDDLASLMQELVAQIRALLLWRAVCSSYDLSS